MHSEMSASGSKVEQPEDAGLVHVDDNDLPGITRRRSGRGFSYHGPDGKRVADSRTLARIKRLAIPPAYHDVWICPLPNGHIQATGRDHRGRKQYKYHPIWVELSSGNKFSRMLRFGRALPKTRARIDRDLRKPGVPFDKVCATVVWLLENSLIRVGNEEYARANRSYGLTTMRVRHVSLGSNRIEFKFAGKRGIMHLVKLSDRRMARILRQISELPGQKLFHYLDEDGNVKEISSGDVNDYIRAISGSEFTAKDFRTWAATVQTTLDLCKRSGLEGALAAKGAVREAITNVARLLGNTPSICRKSYVHPAVVDAYLSGELKEVSRQPRATLANAEKIVLSLLGEERSDSRRQKSRSVRRAMSNAA